MNSRFSPNEVINQFVLATALMGRKAFSGMKSKLPAFGFNHLLAGLRDEGTIKDTFARFVSKDVAEAVLSGRIPLNGDRREVSILFQDMRGFTRMAEQMVPEELVQMLNQLFTEMVAAVEGERGVVKQFIGDGVMAIFGAPVAYSDHAERAVRAALGMVIRLRELNIRLSAQGMPLIRIGVGIHSGEVIAGQIGSGTRVEYAVVGDAVNLASRMESLTKEMQTTIVISEATAARLGAGFILGRTAVLPVKGKAKAVSVVEVLGYELGIAPDVHLPLETEAASWLSPEVIAPSQLRPSAFKGPTYRG